MFPVWRAGLPEPVLLLRSYGSRIGITVREVGVAQVELQVLAEVLRSYPFIDFAVLFGSAAEGRMLPMSDVDVGIYVTRDLSLDELGGLVVALEKAVKRDVDVVIVNDLPRTNPVLAFEAVARGTLLFARDRERYVAEGRIGEPPHGGRTPETP